MKFLAALLAAGVMAKGAAEPLHRGPLWLQEFFSAKTTQSYKVGEKNILLEFHGSPEEPIDCSFLKNQKQAPTCSKDQLARWPSPLVLDAGHNDAVHGNRSDSNPLTMGPEGPPSPVVETRPLKSPPAKAVLSGSSMSLADRYDESLAESDRQAPPGVSEELHEGRGNLAIAMVAKYLFEQCVGKSSGDSSVTLPEIYLSRWPGETYFGQYQAPSWGTLAQSHTGLKPRITSELANESIRQSLSLEQGRLVVGDAFDGTRYALPKNEAFKNHRLAYLNFLLAGAPEGRLDPAGVASFYETRKTGDYPSDQRTLISCHLDTTGEGNPYDPKDVRGENFKFFDQSRLRYGESSHLGEKDIEFWSPLNEAIQNRLNPSYLEILTKMKASSASGTVPSDPSWPQPKALERYEVRTPPPGLLNVGVLGPTVQTRSKFLIEFFSSTGIARAEMAKQVREKSRYVKATVDGQSFEYFISDNHVRAAKGLVEGLLRVECR